MFYDLIIVGGGLAGRSIAAALRHSKLKIALVDAAKEEKHDPRLIALNYGSVCFFDKAGLWSEIKKAGSAIQEVHVSQRGHFGATRLSAAQIQLEALGYVVPAAAINQALAEALASASADYQELRPAKVTAIQCEDGKATLTLQEGEEQRQISATLVIAADGTHSTLRQLLDFETTVVDYRQSALVTTTTLERPHHHRAYERFLADGALAMLPLQDNDKGEARCATIWTASTQSIAELQELPEAEFVQRLQEQFGYRLGRLKGNSARHVFPLQAYQVKNPVKGPVILIGNAAHTIHPVAAQGLNLALYEIHQLTQFILTNHQKEQPLLQDLPANLISGPQKTNLMLSHYLTPLFSSKIWGMNLARQVGMVGLDLCPPLKNRLSRLLAMEQQQWV